MYKHLLPLLLLPALIQLGGCTATTATTAGGAAVAATDQRSFGTQLDDEIIELNASNAIYQDQRLNEQSHVNITSYNFIVLITGETPSKEMRSRIEAIVKSIPKVRRVHNMMIIAAPSSLLSRTSDTTLTARIKAEMLGQGNNFAHRVKVVTENGTTYLMGLVNRAEGDLAVRLTQGVGGVQKIVKLFEYID
jgi:osmotically-inducible protein OsmY